MESSTTNTDLTRKQLLEQFKLAASSRSHEKIVRYGTELLTLEHQAKKLGQTDLGDERWSILERVLIESGPYNLGSWMLYCFSELRQKFPQSLRVKRLAAFIRESLGDYQEALDIYSALITEHPDDVPTRKRLIASLKCAGRNTEAVEYLNKHLSEFAMDQSAWMELAQIYIDEGYLSQALFCYEELILQDPRNVCYVISYAELLASTGDYLLAIDYYTMALALQPDSCRALWGVLRTSLMHGSLERESSDETAKRGSLVRAAAIRLREIYLNLQQIEGPNEWRKMCLKLIEEDHL